MATNALLVLCFHTKGFGNSFSFLLSAVRYSVKFANLPDLSKQDSLLLSFPVLEIALGNGIKHDEGRAINQLCYQRHLTTWLRPILRSYSILERYSSHT